LKGDRARFGELIAAIERAQDAVVQEETGLRSRYEAAQVDASFSMAHAESEGPAAEGGRLNLLERSIVYYEQRIRELRRQAEALEDLLGRARSELVSPDDA
jgi:predicted S18 family serine protease